MLYNSNPLILLLFINASTQRALDNFTRAMRAAREDKLGNITPGSATRGLMSIEEQIRANRVDYDEPYKPFSGSNYWDPD